MTTMTSTRPNLVAELATPPRERPVGLARLTSVELRKAIDTRSGRWLLVAIAVVGLASMAVFTFAGNDHRYVDIAGGGAAFVALLLPVLGILLVTSEWSQRTAQSTFTLVPRRGRVIAAKVGAGSLLALAAGIACAVVAVPFTLIASHPAGAAVWHVGAEPLTALLYQVLFTWFGIAFGLFFLNSPLAIVVYFLAPTLWTTLSTSIHALSGPRHWLDPNSSFEALLNSSASVQDWAQLGVSVLVWIVVPGVSGTLRVRRRAIS